MDRPKEEGGKLAATIFGVTQSARCTRVMKDISQELEWMHREEHQPEFAAKGCGGMGTCATTLIEVAEPSSFGTVSYRLLVHLNGSYSVACPGDTRTPPQSSDVPGGGARTIEERHNFPDKGKPKNLSSKRGLISENFRI